MPVVLSASGGFGKAATALYNRVVACMLSDKRKEPPYWPESGQGSLSLLSAHAQRMLTSVDIPRLNRNLTELWLTFPLCWPQQNATSDPLFHFSSSFTCAAFTFDLGFSIIIILPSRPP